MRSLRCLAAVALFSIAGVEACSAKPANPLLGSWIAEPGGYVDSQRFAFCKVTPKMVFAPTSQTMFNAEGAQGVTKVIYLVSNDTVYVSSTPGFMSAPKYTILGPNEMQSDTMGNCKYRRAG